MVSLQGILTTYLIIFPILIDLIILFHAERIIVIRLKAKLLSYVILKIVLLTIHELVNYI